MSDILAEICAEKRTHIAACKAAVTESALLSRARAATPPRGFHAALRSRIGAGRPALIAEIKKASPSEGVLRKDFRPAAHAAAYEAGGAACLSVLTDIPYFQGSDAYLSDARAGCLLPVLRKDFMLDPYQIVESRTLGADCILLILAALSPAQAAELENAALELGMDVLLEIHDEAELERALTLRSPLIGINNRDLRTLRVDLAASERLRPLIPEGRTPVCESGVDGPAHIARMRRADIHCFLVGSALMRQPDLTAATRALLSL